MHVRLGDLLVERGVLTGAQRDEVLEVQRRCGRPFGELAERLFEVSPAAIESAWANQYARLAPRVDPRECVIPAEVAGLVDRRQAWQFKVLPLGFEEGELLVCTCESGLARALRFCGWRLGHRCVFSIAEPEALGQALMRVYPLGGMSPELVGPLAAG